MDWRNLWILDKLFFPWTLSISFWSLQMLFFSLASNSVMISLLSWDKHYAVCLGWLSILQSKGSQFLLRLINSSDLFRYSATHDWDKIFIGWSLATQNAIALMQHIYLFFYKSPDHDITSQNLRQKEKGLLDHHEIWDLRWQINMPCHFMPTIVQWELNRDGQGRSKVLGHPVFLNTYFIFLIETKKLQTGRYYSVLGR